ncbi:hypothetical protein GCM10008927_13540 [Amylibacter ulvae]|uniref:DUF6891 domain-containing protein n=2 Tax=Paramylibacter ulvae TaxID=1651968 RepID=A0ABQ3CYT6_9RHOB|nr:hypothetical protein GCM10008927_13540 [Amylibacter ulvae]
MGLISFIKSLFTASIKEAGGEPPERGGIEEELRLLNHQYVHHMVRGGYDSKAGIIAAAKHAFRDDETVTESDVEQLVDDAIQELIVEQESWPVETDFDRLTHAMNALEQNGIVARQNFSCCGTCGSLEINDEIKAYNQENKTPARGYVFFHQQATEAVVDGADINFHYGSALDARSETADVAIGQELADAMRNAGFEVDWNGTIRQCVMVGLDWKRRWKIS